MKLKHIALIGSLFLAKYLEIDVRTDVARCVDEKDNQ